MRSWIGGVAVVVSGALLGSFLGRFAALALPEGRWRDLLATDIAAGLHPTQVDLRIVELTFGCVFRFNVLSVAGILLAAALYKRVFR